MVRAILYPCPPTMHWKCHLTRTSNVPELLSMMSSASPLVLATLCIYNIDKDDMLRHGSVPEVDEEKQTSSECRAKNPNWT